MKNPESETALFQIPSAGNIWHFAIIECGLLNLCNAFAKSQNRHWEEASLRKISDKLTDWKTERSIPSKDALSSLLDELFLISPNDAKVIQEDGVERFPKAMELRHLMRMALDMLTESFQELAKTWMVIESRDEAHRNIVMLTAPVIHSVLTFIQIGLIRIFTGSGTWFIHSPETLLQ